MPSRQRRLAGENEGGDRAGGVGDVADGSGGGDVYVAAAIRGGGGGADGDGGEAYGDGHGYADREGYVDAEGYAHEEGYADRERYTVGHGVPPRASKQAAGATQPLVPSPECLAAYDVAAADAGYDVPAGVGDRHHQYDQYRDLRERALPPLASGGPAALHGHAAAAPAQMTTRTNVAATPASSAAAAATATEAPVLHCAAALDAPFSPAQAMERARTVMEASTRMPAVGFFGPPYGDRWYVDAVALPHNAVRRQLYDAFLIANALAKMTHDVAEADLARVYAWLGALDRFVTAVFDAEERYLFPLVDGALRRLGMPYPTDLVLINRTSTKHNILDLIFAARKTRDVTSHEIRPRITALRYALDRFGEAILDYFAFTEGFIPRLLKTGLKHGAKDHAKLERQVFDFFLKQPHGGTLAALLMQCIESRQCRAEFLNRNIKREKEREQFREHVKQVETRHMNLAAMFDKLAMKYERTFGVQTFMDLCGTDVDDGETLQMLGDIDLNEE